MQTLKAINEWLSQFFFMGAFTAGLVWFGVGVVEAIKFLRSRWREAQPADSEKRATQNDTKEPK